MNTTQSSNKNKIAKVAKASKEVEPVVAKAVTLDTSVLQVETAPTSTAPKRSGKKAKQAEEQQPVETTEVTLLVTTEAVVESDAEGDAEEVFNSYDDVAKAVSDVDKQIIQLNRRRAQLTKIANKMYTKETRQLRKKTKSGEGKPERKKSGFNKSAKVPDAFCSYLGLEQGTELPRTNVTALLYKHIKELNMLNPEDKREVMANEELRTLLHMTTAENLKFENFQHFVSRVYKAEAALVISNLESGLVTIKLDQAATDDEEDEDEEDEEAEEAEEA